ncbi:Fungal-trans domain-containing protein [Mycena sanguinolenta]|uniref:Fungal-trans domain-containing protein n=1 Tax=Mycena sanguinolenta TaxID=230812 RepID=A0A8H6XK66_9AGAR|nr:Fungal-trans domain-containing protein [Mycena sanguinolenta]
MLPFGLKLVWFALSLSGLIGCWAVLLPLAWAIQSYWGPIGYAVGITVLEGIFCLGLIWRMNPANIPRGFCLAQVLLTGLATFFIIGVLAAITTATTVYVAKPKQWGPQNETAILPWRVYYLLPMMLFPLLASAVHVTFVIFFDTFEPIDGLNCVGHPLWVRFVGYSGTPFLITIPCLWLSSVSAVRVIRTHSHIRRARRSVNVLHLDLDHFTSLPQKRSKQSMKAPHSVPPTPRAITTPSPSPSFIMQMTSNRESRRQPVSPVLRERS